MFRSLNIWLPAYLKQDKRPHVDGVTDIMFCVCDHFEPFHATDRNNALRRVDAWAEKYISLFSRFKDADSFSPRHTFFYPVEQYDPEILDRLRVFREKNLGEVELHLHHDNDTPQGLKQKLERGREALASHGFLSKDKSGKTRFGFIHGNWALNNSDPSGRNCGVNDETSVLVETGCYADFTMPSAPHPTQTRLINSIYYTAPAQYPKAHDTGVPAQAGNQSHSTPSTINHQPSTLLMVQGPLGLNWRRRKYGILPRIENSELSGRNPPTGQRMKIWSDIGIHIAGKPEWIFIKLHTHGCDEERGNLQMLLGDQMLRFHEHLLSCYNDGAKFRLHYVTARELANIVLASESGAVGNPGDFRDYELRAGGQ